jgi:hypothetical protein
LRMPNGAPQMSNDEKSADGGCYCRDPLRPHAPDRKWWSRRANLRAVDEPLEWRPELRLPWLARSNSNGSVSTRWPGSSHFSSQS